MRQYSDRCPRGRGNKIIQKQTPAMTWVGGTLMRSDVPPTYWGPSAWRLFHYLVSGPPASSRTLVSFFSTIQCVLPCSACRGHYSGHWDKAKNGLQTSNITQQQWVYRIHNEVNNMRGVSRTKWPEYAIVKTKYDRMNWKRVNPWPFLYSSAHAFEKKHARAYERFYRNMARLVKDPAIAEAIRYYMRERPLDRISTQSAFTRWVTGLHRILEPDTCTENSRECLRNIADACTEVCKP